MTHGRVSVVLARTGSPRTAPHAPSRRTPAAHAELRASTEPAALDRAAVAFSARTLAAVAHASTTYGYVVGHRDEADLVERLSQRFDVPAVASCAAAAAALRTEEIARVQLVHPPWFDDDFDELGAMYFRDQGFEAVVTRMEGLPNDPARVHPQHVIDWVEHHVGDQIEAVFLAGNGFRVADAIQELERRTGRLVLEANQAMLWAALTTAAIRWNITGYGRLFQTSTPT
jgi:maleate isomerase